MRQTTFDVGPILPTLEAGPVRLRWLMVDDVPALFAIFGDPEVTRYWGHDALPNLAAAETLLADIHRLFHLRSLFQWGVEAVESGELVGTCTLSNLHRTHRRTELGFALGRAFWGRGYMRAAVPVLLRFAFERLGLHRIVADVDPRNDRSLRLLERLGFRREGYLREHYCCAGEMQDAVVYGLLREEFV